VSLPSLDYSFGDDPLVDSAILVLPYANTVDSSKITRVYGDTATSRYSFVVQQLEQDLSTEKSYLSNKEWAIRDWAPGKTIAGSVTGMLRPNTRATITDVVPGKADTTRLLPVPQLRIRLASEFVQANILDLDSATKSKTSKFNQAFKGLKITVNKAESTGNGGIAFFDFSSTDETTRAKIEIYYKKLQSNSQIQRDTASISFPIGLPVAATLKHDYTGTPIKAQLDVPNPSTPYAVTYLQAAGGLKNKISFTDLKKFVDEAKAGNPKSKIVINKAELVLNVSSGTDVAPYIPAERLTLYRLDIAGQRVNLTDNIEGVGNSRNPRYAGSPAAFGGFYDKKNKRYTFTLTAYLQELIDGTTQDYGTFIGSSSLTQFDISSSISSGARTVLSTKAAGAADKPLKLNIYYTKTD
ncbi:MAG TPA: DUF4270 family protein, partial [Pedobacter sp.]|uniref:DUF4270 family protein n=1 Tax=Pedobacter sp. TaxID=1411316 RepID=UPI002B5BEA74